MTSKFLDFCEQGDMEMIVENLNKGLDVNACDEEGWTGLLCAATRGQSQVCQLLIKKGADLNLGNSFGATPAFICCQENSPACLKLLIDAQADLNARQNTGVSPVFISSEKNHLNCLKMLIEAGANINTPNDKGSTPLQIGCEYNSIESVKLLVKAGADLNFQDRNGLTALGNATLCGNLDCANLLIEGGVDVDLADYGGFSPICTASKYGRKAIAERLIEAGANSAVSGWNGNTGLHLAAWGGKNSLFSSPVWMDCFCGSEAQINKPNCYGYTPVHLAALGKHPSTVQFLIDHGADVNVKTNFGDTPLHCAVMGGDITCIENITRARDLDGSLTNLYGLTPADLYREQYPNKPLPDLIREKVNLTDACQLSTVIPAKRFVEVAKLKENAISLKSVKLIKREQFLKAGEIPHYNTCELNKWHFTAKDVCPSHKVLFISHRWGSQEHPDPDGAQYNIALEFLNSPKGRDIDFIWADYSCICQDKESDLFWEHLKNIPTAVWTATHFLIIPKLVSDNGVLVTHLKDYLGRGWCVLEAMAGVMTGTDCSLGFQVGGYISHELFDRPEGAASNMGFFQSKVNVWNRLLDERHPDFMKARSVGELWNIAEPCAILGLLIKICHSTRPEVQDIVQKALNLKLDLEDIMSAPDEVIKIWNLMGECEFEKDKIPVMNLMIFIGYYSMNMTGSEMNSGSKETEESKATEVKETEQQNVQEAPDRCECDVM